MGGSGKCCFGVMYCEWFGVCDFVVLSVVEVCADYGGVNVFHVCLNLPSYMVLFVVLLCSVVGVWGDVIFVLSVMRVVGGVHLWVDCVFRRVDVVCLCLLYTQLLF